MEKGNFVWSDVVVFKGLRKDVRGYLHLTVEQDGKELTVKMSPKYAPKFSAITSRLGADKKGALIRYRTSRNTGAWSQDEWFSDVFVK